MDVKYGFKGADRLQGFDKPRVWSVLTLLAQQLKAANLVDFILCQGQGFPTWNPPQFYLQYLKQQVDKSNHQYIRSFGSEQLVNAIARFHQKAFAPHKIDPLNDIVTTNGGSQALFCCFVGILNPGDQAIFFDPAYDCYRSQIQMAGGKAIGLPLKPRKSQSKAQVKARLQNSTVCATEQDQWVIDFAQLESSITPKTKILLINSPHNPTGKVFTQAQLQKISQILQKHPQVTIIQDNVYQSMTFDSMFSTPLPKIIHEPNFYPRTVSVYSAGKLLAGTGIRSGWAVGPRNIINAIRSVHTYNVFCYYHVVEVAVAKSLDRMREIGLDHYAGKLRKLRDLLIHELSECKFDVDFWVPQGSNFVIVDVSRCKVKDKYLYDENGNKRTHDYAFSLQLIYEEGVSVIPCSAFYDEKNVEDREKYVRLTFCKDQELIREAGKRMRGDATKGNEK